MPNLIDIIVDTFPANDDVGVPLKTTITILFDREMDETSLDENFFVEGPDTDQYVGPGLIGLEWPYNVSQGDIDDFLKSPGYEGIVQGITTFQNISLTDPTVSGEIGEPYRTKLIFTPTYPLAPSTEYTVNLSDVLTLSGVALASGIVTFSFTSGSGSIEVIPSDVSTSILKTTIQSGPLVESGKFLVLSTDPADHDVEIDEHLGTITVEFNQPIDPATVDATVVDILAQMASDHPNITGTAIGTVVKSVTVSGSKLVITI